MTDSTARLALEYHEWPRPGKIEVIPTKPCATQHDLSLAYTPGVASPSIAIATDPEAAYRYTAKGNLVAVVTNGSAVLGLGDLGPLAAKPVMEGKVALFKTIADIDAFDLELDAADPDQVIAVIKALEPTFGGINLEDVRAPECFYIEAALRRELQIPIFHDDQHGTAIIAGAALVNGLQLARKQIEDIRVVVLGAGAAGIACAEMCLMLGLTRPQLTLVDSTGVVYSGRDRNMNLYKARFARATSRRTLADALRGANVLIGVSAPNQVDAAMLVSMAPRPIVFALSNPDPEVPYSVVAQVRPDALVATGRSDCPNQVNNVLGFPSIFRGALDVRARSVNEAMKLAATRALAELAHQPVPSSVMHAYGLRSVAFGPDYLIPKALDARVVPWVASKVAAAAVRSGASSVTTFEPAIYSEALTRRLAERHVRAVLA
jgi:malate dehydrogenase (oxaloacetate-decarboxylating)(NADP+)